MFQISTFAVSWECSCSVPLLGKFGEILGTLQAHFKCSKFCSFPGMCLQCPQNFPKFSQKQYTAGTLPGTCICTDLEHVWSQDWKFLKNQTMVPKMFQISACAVSWECSCSVLLLGKFGEILGTLQAHFKCSKFCSFPGMCLQCPQNFPKFSQKWNTPKTLQMYWFGTSLVHHSGSFKISKPGTL